MSPAIRLRLVPLLLPCALLAACGDSGPSSTGSIDLFVNPISSPFDPDGWAVSVDGDAARAIPASGEILLEDLAAGDHEVRLTDVDEPCVVTDDNPRTVHVPGGDVEVVSFVVFCDPTGEIAVTTTTTGADLDPDGYRLMVDGMVAPAIAANAELVLASYDPGVHDVTLSGVASNCAVQGGPTTSVTVAARETVQVHFQVVCTAIP